MSWRENTQRVLSRPCLIGVCPPRTWSPAMSYSMRAQRTQPVSMKDRLDVGFCISALSKEWIQHLQIRDRIQVFRRLFRSETSIEIAADRHIPGVSAKLTDVVDVVERGIQCHPRALGPVSQSTRAPSSTHRMAYR